MCKRLTAQEVGGTWVCPRCGFDLTDNYAALPVEAFYRISVGEDGQAWLAYKLINFEGPGEITLLCVKHGEVYLPEAAGEEYT